MHSYSSQDVQTKLAFIISGTLGAGLAIFAAILMTEPGQMLNLNRDWIIFYYDNKLSYAAIVLACYLLFAYLGTKHKIWHPAFLGLAGIGIVMALYVANALLDHFFPSNHRNAVYISVEKADPLLEDDEIVYAVEIGGEAVAYPRRFMMIPHIAGKNIGGQEVALTYCALSNLPVVYASSLGDAEANLGVLIQTNNNLVLYEENSGEVIQQITGETEFGSPQMQRYSNQMMSWGSYKVIYPEGEVFEYKFDRWLDTALMAIFDDGLKKQYDPDKDPMFPTLDLADDRLSQKEQIWGINLNGKQVAFTQDFFNGTPIHNTTVGGRHIVLNYDSTFDTLGVFFRKGAEPTVSVDIYGNSREGKLERVPSYNGVFWMVWSHFYPETAINS